jgi:hypothetical protein
MKTNERKPKVKKPKIRKTKDIFTGEEQVTKTKVDAATINMLMNRRTADANVKVAPAPEPEEAKAP